VKRQSVSSDEDIVTDKSVWSDGNDERLINSNGQRPNARSRISFEPNKIKLEKKNFRIKKNKTNYLFYIFNFVCFSSEKRSSGGSTICFRARLIDGKSTRTGK